MSTNRQNIISIYFLQFKVSEEVNDNSGYLAHFSCNGQYCPENCLKQEWRYAFNGWKRDNTLRVECGEYRIHIISERYKTI